MKTLTRRSLLLAGAMEEMAPPPAWSTLTCKIPTGVLILNGIRWAPRPSPPYGNGWYAGDCDNIDNLIYDMDGE